MCSSPWNSSSLRYDSNFILAEYNRVYSYEELKAGPPPKGLDKMKLESYLSDEEFQGLLHMTKEAFYLLPHWQQDNKRKEIGLY